MKKMMKKVWNSKGFMSLDAIISMGVVLMVIILGIGFFTYMMPKQAIESEVNLLGRMAKMNGGLTAKDVTDFQDKLVRERGYTKENIKVDMVLKNSSGVVTTYKNKAGLTVNPKAITCKSTAYTTTSQGCTDAQKATALYVNRAAQLIMEIRVETPANKKGLLGAFGFFGMGDDSLSDTYVFKERIMSERP